MHWITSLLIGLGLGLGLYSLPHGFDAGDVTEQVNKTVTLAPGSNVRVSGLNGRVKIETYDGNQAEINITIKASSREALESRPLVIEDTPNSLTIRTINDREKGRGEDRGWVHHEVRLRFPRNINLRVSGINGGLTSGQITGQVAVSGVNGSVDVAQAGSVTELSGINGRTVVSLNSLGEGGLKVSGINGGVEIAMPAGTNAEIDVRGVNGGIDTDLPITVLGQMRRGQLTGTIGSGGTKISISGINGGVLLRRI